MEQQLEENFQERFPNQDVLQDETAVCFMQKEIIFGEETLIRQTRCIAGTKF